MSDSVLVIKGYKISGRIERLMAICGLTLYLEVREDQGRIEKSSNIARTYTGFFPK